jgi:hypothetical protein
MSGSFQFTLVDLSDNSNKTITKGVFSYVPYTGGTPIPSQTGADTLNATVNGALFTPPQLIIKTQGVGQGSSLQLLIGGISSDGTQRLALLMPADITPGAYPMDFNQGNYYGLYYPPTNETLVSASNGTLTIISNNTTTRRIKGTFSFKATPIPLTTGTQVTITNGYFSVNY